MKTLGALACGLLVVLSASSRAPAADAPPLERQLVYALEVFDGTGYSATFAPLSEPTIYLLAGRENALSPRYTMVYYWPLSRAYRTDWDALNEPADAASLEILEGMDIIQRCAPTVFSVVFPEGYSSSRSELLWGPEATEGYNSFLMQREEYATRMSEYRTAEQEYERAFNEYMDAMLDPEITNKPAPPRRPDQPAPFDLTVTPPSRGFIVDLAEGAYRVRLKDAEGQTIPESEKQLVVFSYRRIGIGYNIIPVSRWTQPELSDDPQDTIYVNRESNASLYVQPFLEAEFDETKYLRLMDPQDHSGSEDNWVWVHLGPYGPAEMLVVAPESGNELTRVKQRPYSVIQLPGPRLGYQVVEYQPDTMAGQRPAFRGFELSLAQEGAGQRRRLMVRLLDTDGNVVEGGDREIRWLPRNEPWVKYLWLSVPLIAGFGALGLRRLQTRRAGPAVSQRKG